MTRPREELQEILSRCVKCGKCRAVCPVFGAIGREPAAARGKMALLQASLNGGWEKRKKGLQDALSLCLLCGRCTANCPNGAGAKEAVQRARAILVQAEEFPLAKRWLARITSLNRESRDPWVKGAWALQRLLMGEVNNRGLVCKLAGGRLASLWATKIKPPFFLDRFRGTLGAKEPKDRVGLFVGCSIHYLASHVGEATLGILSHMGFQVVIPEEQGCCGLMAFGMGDQVAATRLARQVVEQFFGADLEAIVVPCASCASHLSKGIPELLKDHPLGAGARGVAGKVRELSQFLMERGLPEFLGGRTGKTPRDRVTYHDPCHLAIGMNIRREPRELLGRLSRWSLKEMRGADLCCGMGGSFRLFHPSVSRHISKRKLECIQEAQAEVIATGCMGCWIQLQEMIRGARLEMEVRHLAELIWDELKLNNEEPVGAIKGGLREC